MKVPAPSVLWAYPLWAHVGGAKIKKTRKRKSCAIEDVCCEIKNIKMDDIDSADPKKFSFEYRIIFAFFAFFRIFHKKMVQNRTSISPRRSGKLPKHPSVETLFTSNN